MKFLLSIIIPTYNREKLLNRCLESLDFSQKNVEIIVVDDGSKFKVKDKFKNYKKKIKFYRIDNSGRTYALFYGIKKANSHYIMVLDDDDYFNSDDFLENLVSEIKSFDNNTQSK